MHTNQQQEKSHPESEASHQMSEAVRNRLTTPKISALVTKEQQARFKLRLLSASKALGIVNVPDTNHINVVFSFINKHFGTHYTTGEVLHAFELYALGMLPSEEPIKHYQTFNIEFIALVLQAYAIYRKPIVAKVALNADRQLKQNNEQPFEEYAKSCHETMMEIIYKDTRAVSSMPMDYEACYLYLEHIGEIMLTNEQKKEFMDEHKQYLIELARAARKSFHDSNYNQAMHDVENSEYLKWSCRRQLAINYYELKRKKHDK